MHVISRKALRLFWEQHPDSEVPLSRWFRAVEQTNFDSFPELRTAFPLADKVGELNVFNIAGNKYKLVCSIYFDRGKIYVRAVLTHQEYDRGRRKS